MPHTHSFPPGCVCLFDLVESPRPKGGVNWAGLVNILFGSAVRQDQDDEVFDRSSFAGLIITTHPL